MIVTAYCLLIGLGFFVMSIGGLITSFAPEDKNDSDWERFLSRWSPFVFTPAFIVSLYLLLNLAPALYKAEISGESELFFTKTRECRDIALESRQGYKKCLSEADQLSNLFEN